MITEAALKLMIGFSLVYYLVAFYVVYDSKVYTTGRVYLKYTVLVLISVCFIAVSSCALRVFNLL